MDQLVYQSKTVKKTVFTQDGLVVGAKYENLLTGKTLMPEQYGFEVCYSYTEKGKKLYLRETGGRVADIDKDGYSVRDENGDICVRVVYGESKDGQLQKSLTLSSKKDLFLHFVTAEQFHPSNVSYLWQAPKAGKTYLSSTVARLGQPLYIGDMFFGLEHPMGENFVVKGLAYCRYNTGRLLSEVGKDGVYSIPSLVAGCGRSADFVAMRRAFFEYIESFARPSRFRIQFNSWYDNMLDITPERIKNSFTEVYEGFKKAGLRSLDCYVVDDGWTEYKKPLFWKFNDKFKEGFAKEAELTKGFDSTFGVWFGPRGGYTSQTVKYARLLEKIGYHVNKKSKDICTADKNYIRDLCDVMCEFCKKYNVTYYKIDGFAKKICKEKDHNHPVAKGVGLAFYTFLWEEWIKGFEKIRSVQPDVCLNITSYVHCSPWFLRWADYVWMNNAADMGYAGKGDDLSMCLNYRDGKYRDFYEKRQLQFPAAHMYNHEPCYALKNYNTSRPFDKDKKHVTYTDEEFHTYLKCCMMRGSGLAELYFSPAMMNEEKWKAAADLLKWAEDNFDVLSTSQFFGGRPEKGEVYGYYAVRDGRYVIEVRNSGNKQREYSFDLLGIGKISGKLAPFEIKFIENIKE